MARRKQPQSEPSKPGPSAVPSDDELRRRLGAARRVLLEHIRLDSPEYARHAARLAGAAGLAERVAAYEETLGEIGALDKPGGADV